MPLVGSGIFLTGFEVMVFGLTSALEVDSTFGLVLALGLTSAFGVDSITGLVSTLG